MKAGAKEFVVMTKTDKNIYFRHIGGLPIVYASRNLKRGQDFTCLAIRKLFAGASRKGNNKGVEGKNEYWGETMGQQCENKNLAAAICRRGKLTETRCIECLSSHDFDGLCAVGGGKEFIKMNRIG